MNRKSREKWFGEPLLISVCNPAFNEERSSTNINGRFLHFQLFINGLLDYPYDQTSRDKFFDLCKKEYQDNRQQLSIIKEFEESYVPERALNWYSRQKFLYEMLNKALRIQNVNVLFLFRFFIQDLYKQLKKLKRKQAQKSIRVYRGQYMSKQELDVLKESNGQCISMNSFLSTSLDREISRMFVPTKLGDLCVVIFEIDVDPHLSYGAKPFADISSQSQFRDEKEILFMIASIFRLVNIRQENEITVIQMELCSGNYDHDMKLLLKHMQMENDKYHECFSFGHVLRTARMYDLAEQFYNRMLNELENDHPLVAELWGSIGLVKKAKGEIEISSQCLSKSLEKYEQMRDRTGIARCLQNLANIHHMKGELNQAIDKYSQALNIFHELPGNQDKSIANCLHNLGATYCEQRKFTEAVEYYMVALNIRKTILPHTHPDIATTLNNIGNVYFLKNKYDCALQYFEQALDIFKISLPSEHPSIAKIYYNMSLYYLSKSDYQRSLVFLNRAASIYRNTLSLDHPDVHRCANTIDYVKQKQSQEK
ncbi:unnamed protein product [Rotaria sp. Silwood1]|nr:unnamed protein product [Rotaria sp. Silwood1]CAF5043657.1 unnamed protein product [Rotaria sp. Silwood1]